ncbi:MAG TPA: adenylate kinase [Candidatus Merdousia gallistercoris]|nr:adenylate kinase [Candidatus Merdousia gallistercoris]
MKKANLIMLGAPGSGKGTRAVALCEVLGIVQVSTGDLFRYNIKQDTELGKLAKSYINKGELVPDDVTAAMVKDRLKNPDTANGFILDGFPRTIAQAEMLDKILEELGEKIAYVIYLNVPDAEIIRRISGRLICSECQTSYHKEFNPPKKENICDKCGGKLYTRDDDKPETVRKRLEVFRSTTFPLVDYYKSRGILVEIPPELSEKGAVSDMRELAQKLGLIGK